MLDFTIMSNGVLVTRSRGCIPFSFTWYWSKKVFTPRIFSIRGFTAFTKSSLLFL